MYGSKEEPFFLAKDVADWIDYDGRTGQLLKTVDEDEKLTHTIYASGQKREMWFLTEDGLRAAGEKKKVSSILSRPIISPMKKET
ncbi:MULTISPECIES: BRO-N domain-containing protein [Bacillus cereus group]|uniref:BRO-N domain-containing protein n=1 Tax=Bacillus cereus group TaxID=86661 RepID=UPI000BEB5DFC|nr:MULTISPECIES: BRO family protein [Bacillus cereus group]PEF07704.1 hypothetical protein COM97_05160 [Bacillus thuringiensis]PFD14253.1 hypothetical protein CN295_04740 [Bacillus cereus]PFM34962.1 hypothetical protein COJ43_23690 [Bacillus cereus]PGV83699.1 hypothetical protein COD84_00945 [Bacillus cereus]